MGNNVLLEGENIASLSNGYMDILVILKVILYIVNIIIYFKVVRNILKMKNKKAKIISIISTIVLIIISDIFIRMPEILYSFGTAIDYEPTIMDIIGPYIPPVIQLILNLILLKVTNKQLKKEGETKCQE